ncbi:MAG: hypothetical protein Q4F95_01255 [Oscillospiraceae bacterium]|nr:hypothetical protein [Oscillospiraceae bacterium]
MHSLSYKVALGGIISSMCLLCMFLTGIFPALSIVLPMIAGILMMIIAAEINTSWAFLTFAATSLLSLFVTFDKEASLFYIMLFGHYPIIKKYIDKVKPKVLNIAVKAVIFNFCVITETILTTILLGGDELYEAIQEHGKIIVIILLVMINFICFVYDMSLEGIFELYKRRIKPKLCSGK